MNLILVAPDLGVDADGVVWERRHMPQGFSRPWRRTESRFVGDTAEMVLMIHPEAWSARAYLDAALAADRLKQLSLFAEPAA